MHWSGWRLPGNSCRRRPGGQPADAGKPGPAAAKAAAIDAAQARPLTWKTVVKRALAVATAGAAFYLVLPKLTAVLGVWPQLSTLNPVALAAELASFTCNFALQRLALPTKDWFPVVTAGLAGNAVTNTLPGGDAAGAAVQFRMLTTAGFDTDTAVGGLTTFSLPGAGGLLALPLFALPTILGGAAVSPGSPIPPCSVSPGSSCTRPWARSSCAPAGRWQRSAARRSGCGTGSPRAPAAGDRPGHPAGGRARTIRAVLAAKWRQAVLLTTGRLGFDYGCLLAPRATGAGPQPPWCWPGRRPTCCSATATDGQSPAAPRRERAASRRRTAKGAREAAACRNLPGLPGVVWAASRIRLGRTI
jgi:hypothetical protein